MNLAEYENSLVEYDEFINDLKRKLYYKFKDEIKSFFEIYNEEISMIKTDITISEIDSLSHALAEMHVEDVINYHQPSSMIVEEYFLPENLALEETLVDVEFEEDDIKELWSSKSIPKEEKLHVLGFIQKLEVVKNEIK